MRCGVIGTGALGRGIVASLARAGLPGARARPRRGAAAAGGARRRRGGRVGRRAVAAGCGRDPPDPARLARDLRGRGRDRRRPRRRQRRRSSSAPSRPRRRSSSAGGSPRAASTCSTARSAAGPSRAEAGELAVMVGGDPAVVRARPAGARRDRQRRRPRRAARARPDREAREQPDGRRDRRGRSPRGSRSRPRPAPTSQRVHEAIAGGSGSSWILREWVPETVFADDYARRFSLDLMCKDMRHHQRVRRRSSGVPVPGRRGRARRVRARRGAGATATTTSAARSSCTPRRRAPISAARALTARHLSCHMQQW